MTSPLDAFQHIGLDFDGTLAEEDGRGGVHILPRQLALQDYIRRHPEKTYSIVTHRSHGMEAKIWNLLAQYPAGLQRCDFKEVLNVADAVWEAYEFAKHQPRFLMAGDPDYLAFLAWKSQVCQQHGIEVLVDDDPSLSQQGCLERGVAFINIENLFR